MAIATPISLGLSYSLTNPPPFGGCAIYFHYGVTWLVVCLPPLLFLQNPAKKIKHLGILYPSYKIITHQTTSEDLQVG